jgi:F0F1-type ATP synthase delta subunit
MSKSRVKLASLIADTTLKGEAPKNFTKEVAAYLLDTGDIDDLSSIMRDVQALWAENGRVEVVASSAYALDEAARNEIKQTVMAVYPNAKQVIINEVRNDQVLSGVKLNLANTQLDLTAESKLKQFRHLTTKKGTI